VFDLGDEEEFAVLPDDEAGPAELGAPRSASRSPFAELGPNAGGGAQLGAIGEEEDFPMGAEEEEEPQAPAEEGEEPAKKKERAKAPAKRKSGAKQKGIMKAGAAAKTDGATSARPAPPRRIAIRPRADRPPPQRWRAT
jgi:hypothetical protein